MKCYRLIWALCLIAALALPVRAECVHTFVEKQMEPTCTTSGMSWQECTQCGFSMDFLHFPPLGHSFGAWYVLKEPTCNREGIQARDCARCGHRDEAPIDPSHTFVIEVVAPTCTARGFTIHYCSACGKRFQTDYTAPLGHHYDGGVVISDPTFTAMGRILYTCQNCGDTYQEHIPVLSNPFEDLSKDTFYYTPVLWAVGRGITSGMDQTHFGPDEVCNRAQVAVFLWRLARKPEPASMENPFVDVPAGCFYETAVLWAYHAGIAKGIDSTHFGPGEPCMRAQVVTFLHRFRGCPTVSLDSPFSDVKPGQYFYEAVQWAVSRGITKGMDIGIFGPTQICNRAQIVTFLYRDVKNP